MNSTISLDARIFDNGLKTPIAPPRKKRSTLKKGATLPSTSTDEKIVRNGFKDVFVNGIESHSHSLPYEKVDNEMTQSTRSLERKMKVGNRKSDKILGESLSDHLSDEPVVHDAVDSIPSDKKLFFLMNMLEQSNLNDDEIYLNKVPVEEPICIARKKVTKHICDEDDFDHHSHFHHHEKESQNDPPKKPERDFSKYQKSEEIASTVKKALSRENLPTPPQAPPQRKTGANNAINTPIIKIDDGSSATIEVEKKDNLPKVIETEVKKSPPKQLRRPPSLNLARAKEDHEINREDAPQTAPILTHVIVDEMMKTAYGLQDYHPEDFILHNHDDGSNLVAPTSKLTVRKVSVGRKISSSSTPSLDCDSSSELGGSTSKINDSTLSLDSPRTPSTPKTPTKFYNPTSMNDVIEEIYSKNSEVMKEFQSYLEASIAKNPVVDVAKEKAFIEQKNVKVTEDGFVTHIDENDKKDEEEQHYSDSFESSEEDEQQETIKEMARIRNKFPKYHSARRESIEDVDTWFNRHLDIDEKKSNYENKSGLVLAPVTTYDTQKIFPFGKTVHIEERRESLSDEFFSDLEIFKKNRPNRTESVTESIAEEDNKNQQSEEDTKEVEDDKKSEKNVNEVREKSPDHSTLLKLLNENN